MIDLESYIRYPCELLSITYWKNKNLTLPDNMRIVHHKDFNAEYLKEYHDEEYFRLFHSLRSNANQRGIISVDIIPEWLYFKTVEKDDLPVVVSIINRSYDNLSVDILQMISYTQTEVYDKDLWLIVYNKNDGTPIGCGIADYDREVKEGILEWIQVIPAYRRREVGTAIVNQLLYRLSSKANFATVSGKVKSKTQPEKLYRKCGFVGNDIWHILRKL